MWKRSLRNRLIYILPYLVVASSIAFEISVIAVIALVDQGGTIIPIPFGLFWLLLIVWYAQMRKYIDRPLKVLWNVFYFSSKILVWSGLLVGGVGYLFKQNAITYAGVIIALIGVSILGMAVMSLFLLIVLSIFFGGRE